MRFLTDENEVSPVQMYVYFPGHHLVTFTVVLSLHGNFSVDSM